MRETYEWRRRIRHHVVGRQFTIHNVSCDRIIDPFALNRQSGAIAADKTALLVDALNGRGKRCAFPPNVVVLLATAKEYRLRAVDKLRRGTQIAGVGTGLDLDCLR